MRSVDLNCDMGESFGPWPMGSDAEIMPLISSTNIACGFHAGDPVTIARTIDLAAASGVAVGAHPGYPDLQGFGRRNMTLAVEEVFHMVQYQVAAVKGMCEARGLRLQHVKPHGALYNQAARDAVLADAVARAVVAIDPQLILYGLSGSELVLRGEAAGLQTASEVFADRTYSSDGSLTPRSEPNALINDVQVAAEAAVRMACGDGTLAVDGSKISLRADTICIHGDGPHALQFAKAIRSALAGNGIEVSAPGRKG